MAIFDENAIPTLSSKVSDNSIFDIFLIIFSRL